MIFVGLVAAMLAQAAAVPQEEMTWSDELFCFEAVELPGSGHASLKLWTDLAHRPLRRTIRVWNDDVELTWSAPTWPLGRPGRLQAMASTVTLPLGTEFPIRLEMLVDKRKRWAQDFPQASARMMTWSDRVPRPGLEVKLGPEQRLGLWKARHLTLVAVRQDGTEVLRRQLVLPDWQRLTVRLNDAFRRVEMRRQQHRCSRVGTYVAYG